MNPLVEQTTTWTAGPSAEGLSIDLLPDELWWGGGVEDGVHMPFGKRHFQRNLALGPGGPNGHLPSSNQRCPLLISNRGRVIWSERPFTFVFDDGRLHVTGESEVTVGRGGITLREAFLAASEKFFPPSGRMPAPELFSAPQYNTWIEMPFRPTQSGVLDYAKSLLAAGMPPGIIMIDDNWAPDYGTWHFDATRFSDPAGMVDELHQLGFRVMLWIVPYVSPDSATFRALEAQDFLLKNADGSTAVRRWWNGYSSLLDVSDPDAVAWFRRSLDSLISETGIDGFKFDGGDMRDYRRDDLTTGGLQPADMTEAWVRLAVHYPFNEYRASWKMAGQPVGQRLQDKPPAWGPAGIEGLIPEMLAQGLIGHPFICPDMIGGGEIIAMSEAGETDQEFFVRYAQVAALAPMMQFSMSPARILDKEHADAVYEALRIRQEHIGLIMDLVGKAALTGEPVLRPMAYHAVGCDDVTDQFFLGPDLFVAPVLIPGAVHRVVVLPEGSWQADDGSMHQGPGHAAVPVDLGRIPRFKRVPNDAQTAVAAQDTAALLERVGLQ